MDLAAEWTRDELIPVIFPHFCFVAPICPLILQLSFWKWRDGSQINWPWLKPVVTHLLICPLRCFTNTSGLTREALAPHPAPSAPSTSTGLICTQAPLSWGICYFRKHVPGSRLHMPKRMLGNQSRRKSQKIFVHKWQAFFLWLITFSGIIFCLCEQFSPAYMNMNKEL